MKGNTFAYLVMVVWPLMVIYFYRIKSIQVATLWCFIGGFMFLPVATEIDLPFMPAFGKNSIPVLSAIIGCWLIVNAPIKYFANKGWLKLFVLLIFCAPFMTVMMNKEGIIIGELYLPGLTNHDAFATIFNQLLFVTPFFIGKQFFKTYQDQLLMFKTLISAGLFYSILMLFEIRMSPQLHSWIFGYFPHSFGQQMRYGGFRPVVFMGHGLLVSFFTVLVLISATVLWRSREKIRRFTPAYMSCYFLVLLFLCKSLAALIYGMFAFLLIRSAKHKTQFRVAIILVALSLCYPIMTIMKVFPHQALINLAVSIDGDRAQSLEFRFHNEEVLLAHGRDKFFFGWGGWGRNRVYNEDTGKDETVTDGRWIITFGQYGWFGFIAEFGLLAITVFRANIASKLATQRNELDLLAAHAILVSLIMLDQLPNASLAPWLWLLAGILLGRSEDIIQKNKILNTMPIQTGS